MAEGSAAGVEFTVKEESAMAKRTEVTSDGKINVEQ